MNSTTVLVTAYRLLGDGNGQEWDVNPEYTRAIAELVGDLVGVYIDPAESLDRGGDEWKPAVLGAIRTAGDATLGYCDSHEGLHEFHMDPDACIGWRGVNEELS